MPDSRTDEVNELFLNHLILPVPRAHLVSERIEYQKQKNNLQGEQSAAGAWG
jgi:hypothetical protein